ncbi:MAG: ABC transporter permease [Lachnospiraceae bacterium]|nr:ABC transporter permease [Lachnospiraceae bacterium]
MLKNNNSAVITKMAIKNITANKRKNIVMVIAVILSSFLIFTILTVGQTWFYMQKTQNIRWSGLDEDAYLYGGFTEEQKKVCENNPDISAIGIEGLAGYAVKTEYDDTLNSVFVYADDSLWNKLKKPSIKSVKGVYPQNDNEVMTTKAALKDCGLESLDIGDSFTITYLDNIGEHTKEFKISGIFEGYGDKKVFYVSESFFEQSGYRLEDYGRGFIHIKFKSPLVTEKMINTLEQNLNLNDRQRLFFNAYTEGYTRLLFGMAGLIIITCLSAYLLIYNIMYMSVSGNIRYYGLLQTIGMTGKQICRLVRRQMMIVGGIGIGFGIVGGIFASFGLIPAVVKNFGIHQDDIIIKFNPLIFILSIFIVSVTIYFAGRKPAKIAVMVSPVEALGHRLAESRKISKKSGKGNFIFKMTLEQLRKDKKKTTVVILSLGICLSVFICIVTLVQSNGARTIASSYMDYDFLLKNDTMQMEEQDKWKPLIDEAFLSQLKDNKSIQQVHPITNAEIVIPWEPEFMEKWMEKFYYMWCAEDYEDVKDDYKSHPEKYYSFLTGIDKEEFKYLNSTLEQPVDEDEFMEGKTCILYMNGLKFDFEIEGRDISYYLYNDRNKNYTMSISGTTDDLYYSYCLGTAPMLIVSENFLRSIVKEPFISRVNISYKEEYDEDTEKNILQMIENSNYHKDFSYDSKIEEMHTIKKSQGNMMGIGIAITTILAFIGIMNYMNTCIGNIQSRQTEFSIMESIGMTQKQLRKLLITEGLMYMAGSVLMAMTAGLLATYYIYQSMNYRQIDFTIPIIPVIAAIFLIAAVCAIIPLIGYWSLVRKKSIVERIREFE